MRKKQVPLLGIVLAVMMAALTVIPGAMNGERGEIVEAVSPGGSDAPDVGGAMTEASLDAVTVEETVLGVEESGEAVANCRYGAATSKNSSQYLWVDDLGAGWWLDFNPNYSFPAENGAEYMHVIWVEQARNANGDYLDDYITIPPTDNNSLGYLLQRRPGRMWVVGNETDRAKSASGVGRQGDTMPQMYARIYHEIYHYIKKWDPTALVAPTSLVEFTPGRAQYLDIVYDTYMARYGRQMPVDFWNMHLYILPELEVDGSPSAYASVALGTDPALGIYESGRDKSKCALDNVYCLAEHDSLEAFAEQVVRMRTWMKDHSYQNYPLVITEYSLILPSWEVDENGEDFDPVRVRDFANDTFDYLLNTAVDPDLGYPWDNGRLVQQWMWYSMFLTGNFSTSNLSDSSTDPLSLTLAGEAFSAATRAEAPTVNLIATEANMPMARNTDGTITAKLAVTMRNNGNTRVTTPITVTFSRDADFNDVIATTTVPAPTDDFMGMTGCAVRGLEVKVEASWVEDLPNGNHPFWVKVDSAGSIDETDENDNVASGVLMVVPSGVFLPLLLR